MNCGHRHRHRRRRCRRRCRSTRRRCRTRRRRSQRNPWSTFSTSYRQKMNHPKRTKAKLFQARIERNDGRRINRLQSFDHREEASV